MQQPWHIGCVALTLAAGLAAGLQGCRPMPERLAEDEARAASIFAGDAAAFEALRQDRERAVEVMEEFIGRHGRTDPAQIEQDIQRLANPRPEVSRLALARLNLLPDGAADLLKQHLEHAPSPEFRDRLKAVLASRSRTQKQLAGFLTGLYTEHFGRLFIARRDLLLRDCHSLPAQMFFAYAPFEQTWSMLKNSPAEAQLRFLLLRLLAGREAGALEHLERFSAPQILEAAGRAWWPLELVPPAGENGTRWTLRAAALETNAVVLPLRIMLRPASSPAEPQEWAAIDRWSRWSCVFRYKTPVGNREGVAYAEEANHGLNLRGRARPPQQADQQEGRFWLPEPRATGVIGPGRCEVLRHVPPSLRVPVVAVTRQEAAQWLPGGPYDWARPLFSPAMQAHLQFQVSPLPHPQIFPDQATAQAAGRKRVRKVR